MAGPPSAGKTTFVTRLKSALYDASSVVVVDPTLDLPDDFNSYSMELQKDYRIAAWAVSLEYARSLMLEPKITIIDTCASKFNPLQPIIADALINKHEVVFVFVTASMGECRERAGENWIGDEAYRRYIDDFEHSIPSFYQIKGLKIVVKNRGDSGMADLEEAVNKLATKINGSAS